VKREADCADRADVMVVARRVVLLLAVNDRQFLQEKDRHEADDHRQHQPADVQVLAKRSFGDFRHQIEKRDADDRPR